jgi:isochorismate pyruvate lyase
MKRPHDCKSLEDIRNEIDRIDEEILNLLKQRFDYVKEVVKYKSNDVNGIIAKERYNKVIESRRNIAAKNGLSPDVIEKIYRILLDYFIEEEIKILNKK